MTPIVDAATRNLPPCPLCQALQGDPCRTPNWETTKPHAARERAYKRREEAIRAATGRQGLR